MVSRFVDDTFTAVLDVKDEKEVNDLVEDIAIQGQKHCNHYSRWHRCLSNHQHRRCIRRRRY